MMSWSFNVDRERSCTISQDHDLQGIRVMPTEHHEVLHGREILFRNSERYSA